jgi:glycosyltransferase involved in cell wall biosynthesis
MLPSLSIVVPAYNEEATIGATLDAALAVGAQVAAHCEIIVGNDGSRDATAAIARAYPVRLLDRAHNAGIEATLRELYGAARHDWVFVIGADLQWPMTALVGMAAAADAGADFVIGVRRNKREVYTAYRQVVSWTFERLVRALGGPGGDPGSIKLARRVLLHRPLVAAGVFAEGERMIRAARDGARVVEVGVAFRKRTAGVATGASHKNVARAVIDAGRVASSLAIGWPAPSW